MELARSSIGTQPSWLSHNYKLLLCLESSSEKLDDSLVGAFFEDLELGFDVALEVPSRIFRYDVDVVEFRRVDVGHGRRRRVVLRVPEFHPVNTR